jgi:hypothetical protein
MKKFFIISALLLTTGIAEARSSGGGGSSGFLADVNAFVYNSKAKTNSSSAESNTMIYDLKLGYLPGNGLYVGAIYTSRNHSGTLSDSGSATGASVGYLSDSGFYFMGHYYFTATNGDYSNGSGYQGDFGYLVDVSGPFYVGVELTYRDLTYKKVLGADTNYELTEMFPMLTLGFIF